MNPARASDGSSEVGPVLGERQLHTQVLVSYGYVCTSVVRPVLPLGARATPGGHPGGGWQTSPAPALQAEAGGGRVRGREEGWG